MRLPVTKVQIGFAAGRLRWSEESVDLPARLSPEASEEVLCAPSGRARESEAIELPARGVILLQAPAVEYPERPGPVVGGVPEGLLHDGDEVRVDADRGELELPRVWEVRVVTSFLERTDGRILLLRRSEKVGSFRGRWAAVSGFLESDDPLDQALTEIREETSIAADQVRLAQRGAVLYARDGDRVYRVHPFRFTVGDPSVTLDWEHTESTWIRPEELARYATVPRLDETWASVARRSSPGRKEVRRSEPI
ncbi:MAG TPA: NUDIX domain-containing protein [Thermoplasmata archaeon]|nr:NUDIX domain-containing protein [Thermoplasmata archaeon]